MVICVCDDKGNVDVEDLCVKVEVNKDDLVVLMIIYLFIYGIFELEIVEICKIIYKCGVQVYMDGVNMNVQVGLINLGIIGVDVCYLNLYKIFVSFYGGGGLGVGFVCVVEYLVLFFLGY